MIEEISKSDQILASLESIALDSPQDFLNMEEMNKEMEKVRRDYRWMNGQSEISAENAYFTA